MMFQGDYSVGDTVRAENYKGEEIAGVVDEIDNIAGMVYIDGVKTGADNVVEVLDEDSQGEDDE